MKDKPSMTLPSKLNELLETKCILTPPHITRALARVAKAAEELDREYENPAPDYTMRNVLRQRVSKALSDLSKELGT